LREHTESDSKHIAWLIRCNWGTFWCLYKLYVIRVEISFSYQPPRTAIKYYFAFPIRVLSFTLQT